MSSNSNSGAVEGLIIFLVILAVLTFFGLMISAEPYFDNNSVQMCLELTKSPKCLEAIND